MNTQLYVFTNGAYDKNWLQDIYLINQDNVPAVGSLESIEKMKELLSISSYHSVLLLDKNVIGFSICFREGTSYWSENYKYFAQGLKSFLYIDRIAIDQNYRRKGLGKSMYKDIFSNAYHENYADFIARLRDAYPDKTIIARNVISAEMTEELIIKGADIVKCCGVISKVILPLCCDKKSISSFVVM